VQSQAQELKREYPDALGEPRALTRFLCGLPSPRLMQTKLTKHALFGRLADVPFAQVLAWAEGVGAP
jgi:ATP-dependent DNA helicase RecQ